MNNLKIEAEGMFRPKYYIKCDEFTIYFKIHHKFSNTIISLLDIDDKLIYEVDVEHRLTKTKYYFPNNTYSLVSKISGLEIIDKHDNKYTYEKNKKSFAIYRNNFAHLANINVISYLSYKYQVEQINASNEEIIELIIMFVTHRVSSDLAATTIAVST